MVGRHCPFLNRNDARCAAHFTVNRLSYVFTHCCGEYGSCPSYLELVKERQEERQEAAITHLTIGGRNVGSRLDHAQLVR